MLSQLPPDVANLLSSLDLDGSGFVSDEELVSLVRAWHEQRVANRCVYASGLLSYTARRSLWHLVIG